MNTVTLIGRLTKDVELKEYGKGKEKGVYAKVTVACRASKENTDFVFCTLWGKAAEIAAEYAGKGDLIALTGKVAPGKYEDEDGNTVFTTDIAINSVELLGGRTDENEDEKPAKKKASRKG